MAMAVSVATAIASCASCRAAFVTAVVAFNMAGELPPVCWPEEVVVALVAVAAVGIDRQTPRSDARCRSKDDEGETSAPHKDGGGKQHTRTAAV